MKRKSLIAKRKVDKKNLLIKEYKIQKFYTKFKNKLKTHINKSDFVVAVSGGPDSLCLAYFSKLYSKEFKNKAHVLIVDHKLRNASAKEAIKVKNILKNKGIKSNILKWKGKIPNSNIQKNARNIRYSLISEYCDKKKLKFIITAYHIDDQIENFFIRLLRGSGLTGLSSMSENVNYNKKVKIIRPFLDLKKSELKYVTLNFFGTFIEDPSNKNEKFLRVRIRKYRKNLEKEGLKSDNVITSINNLMHAKKALNFYKNKALLKHVSFMSKNKCIINGKIFSEEAKEIIFKSFSDILSLISGSYYPPRSKKIVSLIERISKPKYNKSTLGGCVIEKKDSFIFVSKELRTKKAYIQPSK